MSIWGIGHNLSGDTQKDISDLFIENRFICLGWDEKEKPQLYNLLNQIQKHDLIYLKNGHQEMMQLKSKQLEL